jgi:hypothetical protein
MCYNNNMKKNNIGMALKEKKNRNNKKIKTT